MDTQSVKTSVRTPVQTPLEYITKLETALKITREYIANCTCICIGGEFGVECKRCEVLSIVDAILPDNW